MTVCNEFLLRSIEGLSCFSSSVTKHASSFLHRLLSLLTLDETQFELLIGRLFIFSQHNLIESLDLSSKLLPQVLILI